ncbi:MAG: BolA family protein [Thioalkalivibrionaceae bacterium]
MNTQQTKQSVIELKLTEAFAPIHLSVENESHRHNVPPGSESHFKVTLVSESFRGLSLIARHRAINRVLAEELAGGVHALALHTMDPDEWLKRAGQVPDSPPCHGGAKAAS